MIMGSPEPPSSEVEVGDGHGVDSSSAMAAAAEVDNWGSSIAATGSFLPRRRNIVILPNLGALAHLQGRRFDNGSKAQGPGHGAQREERRYPLGNRCKTRL
ncbi:hypothetical protein M513_14086 [Trichuris suis]|uniref:Uncharacterized protein n=1 Tax=Trichuris suis TaxID=68888 RepID=A0A085LJ91_9BILA|nr:hypothetical protein M513_14086 [Trichuris suis]